MKIDTQQIRDVSNGIIQRIDNLLAPANSVAFAVNVLFGKKLGRGVLREGTALVGAQIADGKSILGLHQFILSNGTKHLLAVVNGTGNSALYRYITDTWTTESQAGAKDMKHRFLTYLDTVMILDGTNKRSSADGDTWVTSGGNLDIGNCPAGKFPVEWRDRVYVAGVAAALDTVYYSSIPTENAISWTSQNGSITIEPFEGQGAITGLGKVPGYLLIFKERALKRWNGTSTFPDDLCFIGTPSHESIVYGKSTCMFFSASGKNSIGIYETNGESTVKISRPIQDIIEAILPANYANVSGYSDGEVAMWSIGDIVYGDITYNNVVILYHAESKTWSALSFPTCFKIFQPYIDSDSSIKIIAGNDDGEIIQLFTGTTDNYTGKTAQTIPYDLQYHPMEFGSRGKIKTLTKVVPYAKQALGCQVSYRLDENGGFISTPGIKSDYENETTIDKQAHVFELRLNGFGTGGSTELIGIDILLAQITDSIKK